MTGRARKTVLVALVVLFVALSVLLMCVEPNRAPLLDLAGWLLWLLLLGVVYDQACFLLTGGHI